MINYYKALSETGIPIEYPEFMVMTEASKLKVMDATLTSMLKFITDKYNALDFSEIEKSAGDITRFKYNALITENLYTLRSIYNNADASDPGVKKYTEVIDAINTVMNHLKDNRERYSVLYKHGNGLVQLMYTSLVAACLYSIGTLITNTIRFVTVEQDTDCQIMYDEIPGTMKHIHIKNVISAANDISSYNKILDEFYINAANKKSVNESITTSSVVTVLGISALIVYLIPKLITLIREIIYSIYYSRVKLSDMLALQEDLLRTNIESLEAGRGKKKIIVKQKKIVERLDKFRNKISLKIDATNSLTKSEITRENKTMKIDSHSKYKEFIPNELSDNSVMI